MEIFKKKTRLDMSRQITCPTQNKTYFMEKGGHCCPCCGAYIPDRLDLSTFILELPDGHLVNYIKED